MRDDIFRISDDKPMTLSLLADYIGKNDAKARDYYKRLEEAYTNDYPIYRQLPKPNNKPDHRASVNFARYIVDTFEGYFIGIPVKVSSPDQKVNDYVRFLRSYDDGEDKDAELSRLVSIYGRAYEIYFTDEDANEQTAYLDPCESFIIYNEGIQPKPLYFVRTYTDSDNIRHGSISDAYTVRYFSYSPDLRWDGEPQEHYFDGVPVTEFVMNRYRRGLFADVLPLIDIYNRTLSEKANDVDYFADAYLKILGARLDEQTIQFLRDNRIINLSGGDAEKLVVDFMQKPNGDTTQEHLLDRLEKLIFQIAMVADIGDVNFATTSGIALRYKMLPMSNLAKTKERKFKSGFNRRYKMLFSNPVSGMARDSWTSIDYVFTQNYPTDIYSEAQAAAQLAGITSRRTQLSVISSVPDVDAELERIQQEQDADAYMTDYETARTGGDG